MLSSCSPRNAANAGMDPAPSETVSQPSLVDSLEWTLRVAEIPPDLAAEIAEAIHEGPAFILDLLACLEGDPYLRVFVDKSHALPASYVPPDLAELRGGSYSVSRAGLQLRQAAADSLAEMASAAGRDGISLVASSTYRSFEYQGEVYDRIVRTLGQEAADRESAQPGHSQHQLGLAVDFGSIDDTFAETAASHWLIENSGRYGWSLSYPQGYEALTGYRWESWHYRYVGRDLSAFIDAYFQGIQHYALRFIYEWEKAGGF